MWLSGGYNSIYARIQKRKGWKSLKLFETRATNLLYFAQEYVLYINVIMLLVWV